MPSSQKLQIWLKPNCTWMFIGWSSTILRFFVPIWNSKWRLRQDLVQHWTLWEKCFKMLLLWNHLDSWNQTAQEWSLEGPLQISVFFANRKSKMAATAGHILTLDLMGKYSNAFFSETTNMIKAKLYMNVHWMVLYKLKVFCSDMKFKMAATAGFSLTLDPIGKMFQNASSLKPLGQLKPNCPGIVIGRSSTKFMFFLCRSKIQDGHHRRT